jgi:hypothetical protein
MYCALEWKLQENSSVGGVLEYSGVGYVLIRTIKRLGCARIFKYTVYIHWVDILGLGVEVVRYSNVGSLLKYAGVGFVLVRTFTCVGKFNHWLFLKWAYTL